MSTIRLNLLYDQQTTTIYLSKRYVQLKERLCCSAAQTTAWAWIHSQLEWWDRKCLSIAWPGFTLDIYRKGYRRLKYGTVHCGMEQCNVGPWDIFPLELQEQHGGLYVSKTGSLGRWAGARLNGPVLQSLRWDSCSRGTSSGNTHTLMGTQSC